MPTLHARWALLAAAALSAAPAAAAEPVELDRVVAVVRSPASPEGHVLTASKLEEEARILLVARGGALASSAPLDAPALRAALDWLVDQTLLADEAARLRVFEVDAVEARAELERFQARFEGERAYRGFLRRLDLPEEELDAVLRRTLRVSRYLASRVSHAGQLSDAEVSAWLDEHAAALGTRDRDAARAQLAADRVRAETATVLRELRARADVRVVSPPAGRS